MLRGEEVLHFPSPTPALGPTPSALGGRGHGGQRPNLPPAHPGSGERSTHAQSLAQILMLIAKHTQFLASGWVDRCVSHLTSSERQEKKHGQQHLLLIWKLEEDQRVNRGLPKR